MVRFVDTSLIKALYSANSVAKQKHKHYPFSEVTQPVKLFFSSQIGQVEAQRFIKLKEFADAILTTFGLLIKKNYRPNCAKYSILG